MNKLNLLLIILSSLYFLSCSDDNYQNTISSSDLPKVSDIYKSNSETLTFNGGLDLDTDKINDMEYVNSFIESFIDLENQGFHYDAVCHMTYNSNGFINYYKVGINPITNTMFDNGGTIQRNEMNEIISINNNPVDISKNKIRFKASNGWYIGHGATERVVEYSQTKLLKNYHIKYNDQLDFQNYIYKYNNNEFQKKITKSGFKFYEVLDYSNEDFNLPWAIHHSDERLAIEIAFGLRLMNKTPKSMTSSHVDQSIEVTTIIKDDLDRIILILGKNAEYNINHIAVYQYAK